MDQPGKDANPARGQLNRENWVSHVFVSWDVVGREVERACAEKT